MRDLHKKISVVVLSGALLVGSIFSQGAVSYAVSKQNLLDYELPGPVHIQDYLIADSNYYLKEIGPKKYGYRVYIDVENKDKNKDRLENLLRVYPELKDSSKYFRWGPNFLAYLWKYGMKKGLYNFWVAGKSYIIIVPYNIKPGIPYWDAKL